MFSLLHPLLLGLLGAMQTAAPLRCTWDKPVEIGTHDAAVNESSGMAISRRIPDRAYRINDSGDTGRFFVMDFSGRNTRSISISGFRPLDNEDMTIGACGEADCLFIADIGDNRRARTNLEIVVIEEKADFPDEVQPKHRLGIRYPDGPHDAESISVHPDGTIYILTKHPTQQQFFRLKRTQWENAPEATHVLEEVGAIDISKLLPVSTVIDRTPTSMDISPDGKRILILTYRSAVELFVDLSGPFPSPETWKEGEHYRPITLEVLEQQEAIAYLPDGTGFLYDTERPVATRAARIMRVPCKN